MGAWMLFLFISFPFFSFVLWNHLDWKTAVVHIVQFVVYTDLNSALFLAW